MNCSLCRVPDLARLSQLWYLTHRFSFNNRRGGAGEIVETSRVPHERTTDF